MSQTLPNHAFTVTSEQLSTAFDQFVLLGARRERAKIGVIQTVDLGGQWGDGQEQETVELTILFLSPIAQASAQGYQFGPTAARSSSSGRQAFRDSAIDTIKSHLDDITFRVFLKPPTDGSRDIPLISFGLVNGAGNEVQPTTHPTTYLFEGRDIVAAEALAESGRELTFPLFSDGNPNLTVDMNQFSLIVKANGEDQSLPFPL